MIHNNCIYSVCFLFQVSAVWFQQTGQALQDMNPDAEETAELIEELNVAR